MRIEIDTKNDSKEEILAAINILQTALSSRSGQNNSTNPIMLDSSLLSNREEQPLVESFTDLIGVGSEQTKKQEYVGLFDTPRNDSHENQLSANSSGNSGLTQPGLADFFSNASHANQSSSLSSVPKTQQTNNDLISKRNLLNAGSNNERTSFFKEFDDDEENKPAPKVKIVPY